MKLTNAEIVRLFKSGASAVRLANRMALDNGTTLDCAIVAVEYAIRRALVKPVKAKRKAVRK